MKVTSLPLSRMSGRYFQAVLPVPGLDSIDILQGARPKWQVLGQLTPRKCLFNYMPILKPRHENQLDSFLFIYFFSREDSNLGIT